MRVYPMRPPCARLQRYLGRYGERVRRECGNYKAQ